MLAQDLPKACIFLFLQIFISVHIKLNTMTEHLTADTFKEKVFNYEENKEWKFEGEKPCVIDFYADWCGPCRKLEGKTFHDQEVVKESKNFIMVKLDLTKKGTPETVQTLEQYNVRGVPTVVFLTPLGHELQELRVIDFVSAEDFLVRMQKALKNYVPQKGDKG